MGVDAGIADEGIRHGDDLALVGRIGENFLVAGHRGVENNFSNSLSWKTMPFAAKNTAIFQQQRGPPEAADDTLIMVTLHD